MNVEIPYDIFYYFNVLCVFQLEVRFSCISDSLTSFIKENNTRNCIYNMSGKDPETFGKRECGPRLLQSNVNRSSSEAKSVHPYASPSICHCM